MSNVYNRGYASSSSGFDAKHYQRTKGYFRDPIIQTRRNRAAFMSEDTNLVPHVLRTSLRRRQSSVIIVENHLGSCCIIYIYTSWTAMARLKQGTGSNTKF
jgi:hypothetical protein